MRRTMRLRLAVITCALVAMMVAGVMAENKKVPLFGSSDSRTFNLHIDTVAALDTVAFVAGEQYFHRDTLTMVGLTREDGYECYPLQFPIWMYDGFKLYLRISSTSTSDLDSLWYRIKLGNDYRMCLAKEDSTKNATIDTVLDFTPYYDNDSTYYLDWVQIEIFAGDSIDPDAAPQTGYGGEQDHEINASGYIIGID